MDLSYSAEKPEKSLSSVSDTSDRNRDKMALSDWEFLDALQSMTPSSESLDSSSALEMSKFYFNDR